MNKNTKNGIIICLLVLMLSSIGFTSANPKSEEVIRPDNLVKNEDIGFEKVISAKIQQENRIEVFESLIQELDSLQDNNTKMQKINEFIEEQKTFGFPIIHDDEIIFIYRTNSTYIVRIQGGAFDGSTPLDQVTDTDLFFKKFILYSDTRAFYTFKEGSSDDFINDPLNSNMDLCCGHRNISEFRMPEYSDDGSYNFNLEIGSTIVNETYSSTIMDQNYSFQVYLPAGYSESDQTKYKSFYAADGPDYIIDMYAQNILNYLDVNNKTEPLIGIFMTQNNRGTELWGDRLKYGEFLVKELVPYIDTKYRTINDSNYRAHVGLSLGGFFSIYVATQFPETFKLAGSQSGAFQFSFPMIRDTNYTTLNEYYSTEPRIANMRFYLNGGTFEEGILEQTYQLAQTFASKGYPAKFRAFHQGHDLGQWKATFSEMLTFLFSEENSDFSGSPINYGDIKIAKTTASPFWTPLILSITLLVVVFRRRKH